MNIYKFEIKMLIKSMLIWSLSISASLIMYMMFFPMVMQDSTAFVSILDGYPEEFLAFFGMNGDLPFTEISGYFALTYTFVLIPIAIQASNYGFHMLSVEERELTADFLLSKPISRSTIIISKFLAALTSLTVTNVVLWISSYSVIVAFRGDNPVDYSHIAVLLSSTIFFQLFFVSVGMLISVSIKKVSSVLSFSMALGFGMYILSSLGSMLSSNMFNILSPYAHFEPVYILVNGHYNWGLAWVTFVVIILSLGGSYFLYLRRNIASL